jgi:CRP-like cAMP-binding protein
MIEILRQHIVSRLGTNISNIDLVLSKFKPIETKRNEQLLTQGEVCKYVYFIAKGCLHEYSGNHLTHLTDCGSCLTG